MKKIIVGIFAFAVFFTAQNALAYVSWNDDAQSPPADCQGSAVANVTTGSGVPAPGDCWTSTYINANSGNLVNVQLYYHNTGNQPSTNTKLFISVSPAVGQASTIHTFTSHLSSDQGTQDLGTTQIVLPTAQKLIFGTTVWHANQGKNNYQSGAQVITSSSGLSIGTINPGWPSQGATVTSFTVDSYNPPVPCNLSINANPTQINQGGSSNLSWTSSSSCTNVNVTGPNFNYSGNPNSSATIYPINSSNTYTISANNATSQSVTVNVNQNQTCNLSINANPTQINQGGSSYLSWTSSSGCTNVNVSGPNFNYSGNPNSSATIYPINYSNIYTISANNGTSQSVIVYVTQNQNCILSINASPTSINQGSSSILSWTSSSGCTNVNVSGPNFSNYGSLNGSQPVYPTNSSNTYTISATNATSQSVTVYVNQNNTNNCSISYFRASPSSISDGDSSRLSWSTYGNCTSASITRGIGSVSTGNGSENVYPNVDTTYTLTVSDNNGNSDTDTVTVYVDNNQNNNNCDISYFRASQTSINYGSSSSLSWSTNGCDSVSISNIGRVNIYGSQVVYPTNTTDYIIYAYDSNGNSTTDTLRIYVNNYNPAPTPIYNACAVTSVATNIGQNSATLNGINSYNGNAYFEYGTTVGLGNQTTPRWANTGTYSDFLTGLSPNTIYFYRLVSNCSSGVSRGSIEIFETTGTTTNTVRTIIRQGTTVIGTESPIMLKIENKYQEVSVGDTVDYTITYKNIGNKKLTNPILQVVLPKGIAYLKASRGTYTSDNYTLTVSLEDLIAGASGVVYLQGHVDSLNRENAKVVTTAILVYTNTKGAQENAMAYVLNTPIGNTSSLAGLALFGWFFQFGIIGWLLLLILILLIILLFRRIYQTRQN